MEELFKGKRKYQERNQPLAYRMRPRTLKEFVGQSHILGEGKILKKMIETDNIPSLIFYGPPGCGKTALAMLIANITKKHFCFLNAITSTVADVREVIKEAEHKLRETGKPTILFLDEIAHFNKLQQDALMKSVEEGTIILIGATTHNPYFYINTPLLSRAMVFQFHPLGDKEVKKILKNALKDRERGLGRYNVQITEEAIEYIVKMSGGDGRKALNTLELAVSISSPDKNGKIKVDKEVVKECLQERAIVYDRDEDQHYDIISAFIKSMRGSDPDAALYYLARMIVSGEDPRFIARRILICASEDIGNADPQALILALAAYQAVEVIGMPEAKIILAQATIYVSTAPKSNSSYVAIEKAIEEVKKGKLQPVPLHLQQAGYKGAEQLGKGEGYLYPHDFPEHFVLQKYMEEEKKFYFPSDSGYEKKIKLFLEHIEKLKREYERKNKKGNTEKEKQT